MSIIKAVWVVHKHTHTRIHNNTHKLSCNFSATLNKTLTETQEEELKFKTHNLETQSKCLVQQGIYLLSKCV